MKTTRWSILISLLLFLSVPAVHADAPVWKVVKGERQLFIGGTLHLLSKSDYPLPEAFEDAYRQSAIVVFESDLEKMQTPEFQQLLQSKMVYTDGRSLQTVLSTKTYRALERHMTSRGLPIAGFQKMKPGMLAITLTLVELQRKGLYGTGVDEFFNQKARSDGKRIGKLETAEKQVAFLSTLGDGREDDLITHTLRDLKRLPEIITKLKAAWRNGNRSGIKAIAITPIQKDFPKVYHNLLVQRNMDWIPRIEEMMETMEVEFILVGAAHLVGEDGILAQLAARGYTIQEP